MSECSQVLGAQQDAWSDVGFYSDMLSMFYHNAGSDPAQWTTHQLDNYIFISGALAQAESFYILATRMVDIACD